MLSSFRANLELAFWDSTLKSDTSLVALPFSVCLRQVNDSSGFKILSLKMWPHEAAG